MALWSSQDLQRWRANEQEVLARLRTEPEDDLFVQPPSAERVRGVPEWVKIKKVSGSAGDLTTKSSWGYDGWLPTGDIQNDDERIFEGLQPQYGRCDEGAYDFAATGSWALAVRDPSSGAWTLLYVYDEVEDTGGCSGA